MNRVASHSTNSSPPSIGVCSRTGHLPYGHFLSKTVPQILHQR